MSYERNNTCSLILQKNHSICEWLIAACPELVERES